LTADGRLAEKANAWNRDDPKWRAQELAYDAMETDDVIEALRLAHEATTLDPGCADAQRLIVAVMPMSTENRLQLVREVVEEAERSLVEAYFAENAGHFWSSIATRPYMRTMQYMGELLAETGDLAGAASVFERMLELNPGDNQGMRYPLLAF
jgi:tetratricopeptide (TPR) repeat protein